LVWLPAYVLSESLYLPLALANVLLLGRIITGTSSPSWLLAAPHVV
jgi:hypothetical protein